MTSAHPSFKSMAPSGPVLFDDRFRQLPSVFALPDAWIPKEGEEVIRVGDVVSPAAALYERMRNLLEYEDEHVLRRNAIRRLLRRFAETEDVDVAAVTQELFRELIWARYLPNAALPVRLQDEVAGVLKKYRPLWRVAWEAPKRARWFDALLDLLSQEVEQRLAPPAREDALAGFLFRLLQERLEWSRSGVKEDDREALIYLAVYRALWKADVPRLRLRVLMLRMPAWKDGAEDVEGAAVAKQFEETLREMDALVFHPQRDQVLRAVLPKAVAFRTLMDVAAGAPERFLELFSSGAALDKAVGTAGAERIRQFHARRRRRAIRAVAFLFFTKMLFALALELPYDLLVVHETKWYPLIVNVLFPPLLLTWIVFTHRVPVSLHVKAIQKAVRYLLAPSPAAKDRIKGRTRLRGWIGGIFWFGYATTYLLTFGVMGWFLWSFGFNVVSAVIFLLFLSLVTFFGTRIRQLSKDVVVTTKRGGLFVALLDMLALPIIRVGRWISMRAPRINVFLFFLDYLIEAPFKMVIGIVESWVAFIREKKEET